MNQFVIRSNRPLAATMVVIAVIGLLLSIFAGTFMPTGIVFPILALIGVLQLRAVPVVVTDRDVQLRNLLGKTIRRFEIDSLGDLRLENKKLVQVSTGKALARLGFGFDQKDVATLGAAIGAAGPVGPGDVRPNEA